MLRGMYTASGAMQALQRQQEMLSNNLANARTPGFRADQASLRTFPEMMIHQAATNERTGIRPAGNVGTLATGVFMQAATPNFAPGSITETGNATDLQISSIDGVPMFTIFHNNGEGTAREGEVLYTTNGQFAVDRDGILRTTDGDQVLDEDGNAMNVGNDDFKVSPEGVVTRGNGERVGRLGLVTTNNTEQLERVENGLYRAPEALAQGNVKVDQGVLELGNVAIEQTMAEMNAGLRQFEANQKVIQAYDRTAEKAVSEIGRVR